MGYKILADIVIFIHFLWIAFIISGFIFTIFLWRKFLHKITIRIIHLLSILYAAYLELTEKYCPLTILENYLKAKSNDVTYTGSFGIHYIEKLVYPDVEPAVVIVPTILVGVITLFMFVVKPPRKIKEIVCGK